MRYNTIKQNKPNGSIQRGAINTSLALRIKKRPMKEAVE
jgi:hypothetical protein